MKRKIVSLLLCGALALCPVAVSGAEVNYNDPALIKEVQEALNASGFDCGVPDGIVGNATTSAIQLYRDSKSLPAGNSIDQDLLVALGVTDAPADTATTEEAAKDFTVSFRNIPWYSKFADAEASLIAEGAAPKDDAWENYARRLSSIEFARTMSGKDYIDGGGLGRNYPGLTVAGLTPSETGACYIYPIGDDGRIDRTVDNSEFYFGWYIFDSNDFVDSYGLYDSLLEKLSSLYGTGSVDDQSDHFDTTAWTDAAGNKIRLTLSGLKNEYQSVTLGYIAAGAEEKLTAMQTALDNEAKAQEAVERESVKDNTDGL